MRYELYDIPDARANAPLAISQKFHRHTNNFAPRLRLSYIWSHGIDDAPEINVRFDRVSL